MKPFTKEYTVLTQKPLIASAAKIAPDDTRSALTNYSPRRSVTQIGNGDWIGEAQLLYTHI